MIYPTNLIEDVMERWDDPVLRQNTNQIARSIAGRWEPDEPRVDRIVSQVLQQRWAKKRAGAA